MKLKLLAVVPIVAMSCLSAISCNGSEQESKKKSMGESANTELSKRDQEKRKALKIKTSLDLIDQRYPAWKIYAYCSVDMDNRTPEDVVVTLINTKEKLSSVAVILRSSEGNVLHEIARSSASIEYFKEIGLISETSIKCFNHSAAIKQNENISRSLGVHGKIEIRNKLDVLCLTSPSIGAAFDCYSYNSEVKKFARIGGWVL